MERREGCGSTHPGRGPLPGNRISAGAALLLLAFSRGAIAAPRDALVAANDLKHLSLIELMNVTVTSVARRPQKLSQSASAIQVITADDIRRSGASSIPEALRLADNLDVAQKDSHDWGITARGFNTALANKLLVMIDGRTVYTPLFSGVFWDQQDYLLEDIDRIEVISGPGGTQWGANAVNGVINIITKKPEDTQGLYVEGGGGNELQDFAGARYGAQFGAHTYMRVYGKYFDRAHEKLADGSDANDAWNQGRAGFRLTTEASARDSLNVQGDIFDGNEEDVSGGTGGASGGNILAGWSHHISDTSMTNLRFYWDRAHLDAVQPAYVVNNVVIGPAGTLVDDLNTYDVDFDHRFQWTGGTLVWGLGYRHTHDEVGNVAPLSFEPPVLDQDLYSGFVQDEIPLRHNLVFTLGSKLEHNDYTGYEVEPSTRLLWSVTSRQTLWGAISRAVRTPSRIDRDVVQPARSTGLLVLEGTPGFRSEKVIAYELGYRAQVSDQLSAAAAFFYNRYDDVRSIGLTPVTQLPLMFQNGLDGETHGAELTLDYKPLDWWRLHFAYDPLKEDIHVKTGQFDLTGGEYETSDPAQRIALRSSMDLPHHVEVDTALRWIDTRPVDVGSGLAYIPSYGEMDLRLAWHPRDRLELSVVGQNLLHDQHAEYSYPAPDQPQIARAVYGKLQWRWQ